MEDKRKNKCRCKTVRQAGGFEGGYGYPIDFYNMDDYPGPKPMPKVKGSFWVACNEKAKGRHSFCDGQ